MADYKVPKRDDSGKILNSYKKKEKFAMYSVPATFGTMFGLGLYAAPILAPIAPIAAAFTGLMGIGTYLMAKNNKKNRIFNYEKKIKEVDNLDSILDKKVDANRYVINKLYKKGNKKVRKYLQNEDNSKSLVELISGYVNTLKNNNVLTKEQKYAKINNYVNSLEQELVKKYNVFKKENVLNYFSNIKKNKLKPKYDKIKNSKYNILKKKSNTVSVSSN